MNSPIPSRVRILVIEDNLDDALLITLELSRAHPSLKCDIDVAETFQRGMERVQSQPPDLVFLDLRLPDATGFDSVEQLRRVAPNVPIVVLTGLANEALSLSVIQQGAQYFLSKDSILEGRLQQVVIRVLGQVLEQTGGWLGNIQPAEEG